jgi:signal transduction histidine kinase/BarA-like signal transduction histidine kinase
MNQFIEELMQMSEGVNLLYVEDDIDTQEAVKSSFEHFSFNLFVASNGEEGLEVFKNNPIDLVITDLNMPIMCGLDMIDAIKKINDDIAVIVFSAHEKLEYFSRAIELGIDGFIAKPINYDHFFKTIHKAVKSILVKHDLALKQKELEEAKLRAELANRAKTIFLANMSHEIRTPLNAISGFVDILLEEIENPTHKSYMQTIQSNTGTLLKIISDILDLTKIEYNQLEMHPEYADLKQEIGGIVELFKTQAYHKDIDFQYTIKSENSILQCSTDFLRLKQILSNLLSNAIKFTPSKGRVTLEIINNNVSEIEFSVQDSGIGIDESYLKTIFDPFTQENLSTTKEFGGSGLGLAIANQLVALLGGELSVHSVKNEGSRFSFTIPYRCKNEQKEGSKEEELDEAVLNGKSILLVEDNPSNQMLMKIILKKLKLNFDVAANGKEAVEQYQKSSYDFILMDENMPIMNGIEATKKILEFEKERQKPHTPIIALTANSIKGDRERFLEAGMDEYLSKPIKKAQLIAMLIKFV